jgi:hypothetical protein
MRCRLLKRRRFPIDDPGCRAHPVRVSGTPSPSGLPKKARDITMTRPALRAIAASSATVLALVAGGTAAGAAITGGPIDGKRA